MLVKKDDLTEEECLAKGKSLIYLEGGYASIALGLEKEKNLSEIEKGVPFGYSTVQKKVNELVKTGLVGKRRKYPGLEKKKEMHDYYLKGRVLKGIETPFIGEIALALISLVLYLSLRYYDPFPGFPYFILPFSIWFFWSLYRYLGWKS